MNLSANSRVRDLAVAFYSWLCFQSRRLGPNPLHEMAGDLESIVDDGFELLGSGTMGDRTSKSEKTLINR